MDFIERLNNINSTEIDKLNDLYEELLINHSNKELDYIFYSLKKFIYTNIKTEEKKVRNDDTFKDTVINKYKRCIITNKPKYICEVAHIFPFAECSEIDKYDPDNGILLCRELHVLFDTNLMKIDYRTLKITFDEKILNDTYLTDYHKYHNTIIKMDISKNYLKKKYGN